MSTDSTSERDLEELSRTADLIDAYIGQGRFVAAATLVDNLPEDYNKDAFYAALALKSSRPFGEAEETEAAKEIREGMRDHYKSRCSYFSE